MTRTLLAAIVAALATGCVTTPNHLEYFEPDEAKTFAGFASDNGNLVRVQARRKDSGQWVTLTTLIPEPDAYNYAGETWYQWIGTVVLTTRPEWRCFFTSSCSTPYSILSADFRVIEQGGDISPLYTRTEAEEDCMQPLLLEIGIEAAWEQCATPRQHLTLRWDNRLRPVDGGIRL